MANDIMNKTRELRHLIDSLKSDENYLMVTTEIQTKVSQLIPLYLGRLDAQLKKNGISSTRKWNCVSVGTLNISCRHEMYGMFVFDIHDTGRKKEVSGLSMDAVKKYVNEHR